MEYREANVSTVTQQHGSFGEYSVSTAASHRFSLPSAQEMAGLDRETIERGVPGLELMERAGVAIAQRICEAFPRAKKAIVLCGPGNNGGDGVVIARVMAERGFEVSVVLAAAQRYSVECETQLLTARAVRIFGGTPGLQLLDSGSFLPVTTPELRELLQASDIVIDALLGTGQRDAPRGPLGELVELVSAAGQPSRRYSVVAVDVPTGVDSDTGRTHTPHIVADRTIAVQCIKRGMLHFPGRSACGVIEVVDIGITGQTPVEFSLVARENVPSMVPRPPDAHKGMLGRVLVVGGSLAMPGAPMLAALGALRTGAGIVSRCVRIGWQTIPPLPEAMFEVLSGDATTLQMADVPRVVEMAGRHDVVVIGPGVGTESGTVDCIVAVLEALKARGARVIVDADALTALALRRVTLKGLSAIVTPHPGEAARLLGVTSQEVQRDRFGAVREVSRRVEAITVLKGAGSLIHDGAIGRLVAEGTPYLATPGSGDVLAGILAACAVRTRSLWEGAVLGVWLHAQAGTRAATSRRGPILASEIAEHLGTFVGEQE